MKTSNLIHKRLFNVALLALALAQIPEARAVGYVNTTFQPGANLFGNPLDASAGVSDPNRRNDLNTLFPTAPDGTIVSLWDAPALQFSQTSLFTGGAWTVNLTLAPGTGALLTTPSSFANAFFGAVLDASGEPIRLVPGGYDINPPLAFGGPDGLYLFSSTLPATLPYTSGPNDLPPNTRFSAFDLIIGRAPSAGESVTRLDAMTQTYFTTTFDGVDWDNGAPGLDVGEAAFFNVGPVTVPEPSTFALCVFSILGVLGARWWRRKRGC